MGSATIRNVLYLFKFMSAGVFAQARYRASYSAVAQIHPIRVQPETVGLTIEGVGNDAPTDPITNPISARVSGGRRGAGLFARTVTLQFVSTLPAGYTPTGRLRVPLLNPEIAAVASRGAAGVYLTLPVTVVGTQAEVVR